MLRIDDVEDLGVEERHVRLNVLEEVGLHEVTSVNSDRHFFD